MKKEQNSSGEEIEKSEDNQLKPAPSKSIVKTGLDNQASSTILPGKNLSFFFSSISLIQKIDQNQSLKLPIAEQTNSIFSSIDLDNDYIEPESPTGIDALIYDEDDNDNDLNNTNISSHSSTNHSPVDNTEFILPYQQTIRDDYNPSKAQNETPLM